MAVEWFYTTNKQQMGPVSWDELRELANVGILKPHDMVWADGMDEWVKAINQGGLFSDEDGGGPPTKKAKFKPGKPPPARRAARKHVAEDEEDDEDEEDARKQRRESRKREESRYKMGVGIRIVLTLAGVGLLIVLLGGCVIGLFAMSFGGGGAGGGGPAPGVLVRDNFAWNGLGERKHMEKVYRFTQGKRVVINVTNAIFNPNTNVDLMIFRGNEQNPNAAFVADRRFPQQDRNCRVEFIVPATGDYRIRVANFGPGMANCQVTVDES